MLNGAAVLVFIAFATPAEPEPLVVSLTCSPAALRDFDCSTIAEKMSIYANDYRVMSAPKADSDDVVIAIALDVLGSGSSRVCQITLVDRLSANAPEREELVHCAPSRDAERRIALAIHNAMKSQIEEVLALLRDAPLRHHAASAPVSLAATQPTKEAATKPAPEPAMIARGPGPAPSIVRGWSLFFGAGIDAWDKPLHPSIAFAGAVDLPLQLGLELGVHYGFAESWNVSSRTVTASAFAPQLRVRWRAVTRERFAIELAAVLELELGLFQLPGHALVVAPDAGAGVGVRGTVRIYAWLWVALDASAVALFTRLELQSGNVRIGEQLPYAISLALGPLVRIP